MVDVSPKPETAREAVARAILRMRPATLRAVQRGNAPKGDVFGVARTAGILAAKRTPELIPLCHPLRLTRVDVSFETDARRGEVAVQARVCTVDKTGVEMEALTAASVAALTVYDMVKALEKGVTITRLQLLQKSGGKSGNWTRARQSRSKEERSRQPSRPGHPRPNPSPRAPLQK
jgi:cyclic pyranopterin phosphate synthase